MKPLLTTLASLFAVQTFASDCTINTSNLHFNDTSGTKKIESILRHKGYTVTSEEGVTATHSLEIRYYGNGVDKTLHMMVWAKYPEQFFSQELDYKTPFGIEGGIFERVHAVGLAKQIPNCN